MSADTTELDKVPDRVGQMRKFTLPYPPSINHYYAIAHRRLRITKAGKLYRQNVLASVCADGLPETIGRLMVWIELYPPDNRTRDLDNTLKALLDAMQHAGLYKNDGAIDILRVDRKSVVTGGLVIVRIWPLEGTLAFPEI